MPSVQQRPNAVTVIAVCNFIFGGLGLLGVCCGGLGILFLGAIADSMPPQPGGGPNPLKELADLFQTIPGYIPFMIATVAMGGIMAVVLIASGFGLLKLKKWARIACMVYAIYTILAQIGGGVYQFTVVQPAMDKWAADFQARMQKNAPGAPAAPPPTSNVGGAVGGVVGSLFGIAYAVAILVVMNLAHVREAFARGLVPVDQEVDRAWRRDDDDRYPREEGYGRLREDDDRIQGER